MGNLEQRMSKVKSLQELSVSFKHLQQTRSDSEIQITNKLTELLSDLNVKRILKTKQHTDVKLDWSQYTFVCIQGLPALENQFNMLELPGQTVYFSGINFSQSARKSSEKIRTQFVLRSTFKQQAKRLNQLFNSLKSRKIILVYHSVGNLFLGMYFYYYGYGIAQKIKGMIDISGLPLRYYLSAQFLTPLIIDTDFNDILQNADKVHKLFIKSITGTGFQLDGFKTKYQTLSFLHYVKSPNYEQAFDTTWNHPQVLKLFIHGRNDTLFETKLLNQKVIYYAYRKSINETLQKRLKQRYKELYRVQNAPQNLQERFIITIPKAQHSVHLPVKNHEIIRKAVQDYLHIIHQ